MQTAISSPKVDDLSVSPGVHLHLHPLKCILHCLFLKSVWTHELCVQLCGHALKSVWSQGFEIPLWMSWTIFFFLTWMVLGDCPLRVLTMTSHPWCTGGGSCCYPPPPPPPYLHSRSHNTGQIHRCVDCFLIWHISTDIRTKDLQLSHSEWHLYRSTWCMCGCVEQKLIGCIEAIMWLECFLISYKLVVKTTHNFTSPHLMGGGVCSCVCGT